MFVRPFFLLGASGKSANWSTWWIMDGGDDATQVITWEMPLRSNLFMMLCELPMWKDHWMIKFSRWSEVFTHGVFGLTTLCHELCGTPGTFVGVEAFLTGDGNANILILIPTVSKASKSNESECNAPHQLPRRWEVLDVRRTFEVLAGQAPCHSSISGWPSTQVQFYWLRFVNDTVPTCVTSRCRIA